MKPPVDLPSVLVALGEAYARQAGIAPGDFWAFVYRHRAPPTATRDSIVAAFFPAVAPGDFLSTSPAENGTTDTMDASKVSSEPARRSRAMMTDETLMQRLPKVLVKLGVTVTELAKEMGFPRTTVQSWCRKKGDPARRPCPPEARKCLARPPYNIPVDSWD